MYTKSWLRKNSMWWKCSKKGSLGYWASWGTTLDQTDAMPGQLHNHVPNETRIIYIKCRNAWPNRHVHRQTSKTISRSCLMWHLWPRHSFLLKRTQNGACIISIVHRQYLRSLKISPSQMSVLRLIWTISRTVPALWRWSRVQQQDYPSVCGRQSYGSKKNIQLFKLYSSRISTKDKC